MKNFYFVLLLLLTMFCCHVKATAVGDLIQDGNVVYIVTNTTSHTASVYQVDPKVSGELVIPSSVSDADGQAYSVTGMKKECLFDAAVTKITLPSTMTEVKLEPMCLTCPTLTEIAIDGNSSELQVVDGVLLNANGQRLEAYPANKAATEYTLPATVQRVMPFAFAESRNLETLTIDKACIYTQEWDSSKGYGAWANIKSLKAFKVEDGHPFYKVADGSLIRKDHNGKDGYCLVSYPAGKTEKVFTTPDTIITLYPWSISGASNLEQLNLSKIQYWDQPGIVNCRNLRTISGTNSTYLLFKDNAIYTAEDNKLLYAVSVDGGTFSIPDGTTAVSTYALSYSNFDKVIVPSSVKTLGECAFYGSNVKEIDLSQSSISNIYYFPFDRCPNLRSLSLPSTVTEFGFNTPVALNDKNLAYIDMSKTSLSISKVDRSSGTFKNVDAHTLIFLPATNTITGENIVNTDADGNRTSESVTVPSTATSFATPYDFTATKLTFDRTFTANQYTTLTLPFSLTADETAKLGKIYALNAPENNVEESEAFFDETKDVISANKPYLVLPSRSITSAFTKENVTIEATPTEVSEGFNPCFYATNEKGDLGLNAEFATTTDPAFTALSDGQKVQPFHAYWKSSSFTNVPVVFDYISAKVSDTGYATLYYSDKALKIPNGVSALTIKLSDNEVTMSKEYTVGNVLPKATGVVLKAPAGTYHFAVSSETGTADASNLLSGSDEAANTTGPTGAKFYLLSKSEDGVGFFYGAENGAAFQNGAHKAYLVVSGTSAAKPMYLFGKTGPTTNIRTINAIGGQNAPCYSLDGRRVSPTYKGIVIRNGKKVINK